MSSIYEKWIKLNATQQFDESLLDYTVVRQHEQMLEQFLTAGDSNAYIFDAYRQRYIYASQNCNELLGPDFREMLTNKEVRILKTVVHPDDYALFEEMRLHFYTFLLSLPVMQRKDYKFLHQYRILNSHHEYVRFYLRQQVLELDSRGNIWLVMGIMDLAPDQNPNQGFEASILNYKTAKKLLLAEFINNNAPKLTRREKEVLLLMKAGLLSKEISDRLSISINTINNHRQNILKKTNASNAIEAIQFAEKMGMV